jgi:hypothetical protein
MADEREVPEAAARACYQRIGVPFPDRVGWVPSPLVGAFAAPIAACLATGHRNQRVLDSVYGAIDGAAGASTGSAVRDAVGWAADGAVGDPVHGAAATALHADLRAANDAADAGWGPEPAVPAGLRRSTEAATEAAVRAVVDGVVGSARQDTIRGAIRRLWRARLVVPGSGGWWWPFRDFVMLAPRPAELHVEQSGEQARGSDRPHRADGPAVGWADGFGLYFWHGIQVSRAVIDDTLTTEEILGERNAEIRRCAIEVRGWDRFVDEAGLAQVGEPVADPGNPGQTLTLHDVPADVFSSHVRVLLCTNGTVERDGTRRRFGLTVPAGLADPIEAAAWTYGLTTKQYRQAQRRS